MIPWITLLIFAAVGAWRAGPAGFVAGAIFGVVFNVGLGTAVRRIQKRGGDKRARGFVETWKNENPEAPVDWRPLKVRVDFLPGVYEGYSSSLHWGKFAWPQFPASEARRVATDLVLAGGLSRYDKKLDSYFIRGPHETEEVQVWGHEGAVGKLYDVGGGQWEWNEVGQ